MKPYILLAAIVLLGLTGTDAHPHLFPVSVGGAAYGTPPVPGAGSCFGLLAGRGHIPSEGVKLLNPCVPLISALDNSSSVLRGRPTASPRTTKLKVAEGCFVNDRVLDEKMLAVFQRAVLFGIELVLRIQCVKLFSRLGIPRLDEFHFVHYAWGFQPELLIETRHGIWKGLFNGFWYGAYRARLKTEGLDVDTERLDHCPSTTNILKGVDKEYPLRRIDFLPSLQEDKLSPLTVDLGINGSLGRFEGAPHDPPRSKGGEGKDAGKEGHPLFGSESISPAECFLYGCIGGLIYALAAWVEYKRGNKGH